MRNLSSLAVATFVPNGFQATECTGSRWVGGVEVAPGPGKVNVIRGVRRLRDPDVPRGAPLGLHHRERSVENHGTWFGFALVIYHLYKPFGGQQGSRNDPKPYSSPPS